MLARTKGSVNKIYCSPPPHPPMQHMLISGCQSQLQFCLLKIQNNNSMWGLALSLVPLHVKQNVKWCITYLKVLYWNLNERLTDISVDRYIGVPIFFPIFKHFAIIGYRFWIFFVIYTIIQSITSSEMCSLYLTHPSAHTPGAVDTHTHTHTWSSGHCSLRKCSSTATTCNF